MIKEKHLLEFIECFISPKNNKNLKYISDEIIAVINLQTFIFKSSIFSLLIFTNLISIIINFIFFRSLNINKRIKLINLLIKIFPPYRIFIRFLKSYSLMIYYSE